VVDKSVTTRMKGEIEELLYDALITATIDHVRLKRSSRKYGICRTKF